MALLPKIPPDTCRRCGTCCRKGGPAFHLCDLSLIADGAIPARDLYTIRAGEMVHDNVRGILKPTPSDIIKIKDAADAPGCIYYRAAEGACGIYGERPLECRVLTCWDTREIERVYQAERLSRRDLLAGAADLMEMIAVHQERCDYARIYAVIRALKAGGGKRFEAELDAIMRHDTAFRHRIQAAGMGGEMLDFLFGRPLTRTLAPFGITS